MQPISTLKDLLQATVEMLTVVSSHAQYLSDRKDIPGDCRKDADIIVLEARVIAGHLAMIPPHLADTILRKKAGESTPISRSP